MLNSTKSSFQILFFILLGIVNCKADHLLGGEIAWKSLGSNKYLVMVNVLRDCGGASLSNTSIRFAGNCSGISKTSQTISMASDVTPVCPGQCTQCSDSTCSFKYGVEEYTLSTIIDVSQFKKNGCCEISISWSQCCRSPNITTGAGGQIFYLEALMNICASPADNSPIFAKKPFTFLCLGQDAILDAGAYDNDTFSNGQKSDSLVYSFADPLTNASTKTSWKSPYSRQYPFCYLGAPHKYKVSQFPFGIHLDSTTGQLMFRPMCLSHSVFSIKVEVYRNGKKIAEINKESQIIIIKCPNNNPPVLSAINCSKPIPENFEITTCAGREVCFDICSSDKDKNDTVKLSWINNIKGSSIKVTNKGSKREQAQFCWTPELKDVSNQAYSFVVKAKDNVCPLNGRVDRVYKIKVLPPQNFSVKLELKPKDLCGNYLLNATVLDSQNNTEWKWYLNDTLPIRTAIDTGLVDSFQYQFSENGKYPITLKSKRLGCILSFNDTINVQYLKPIKLESLTDTSLCASTFINRPFLSLNGYGKLKAFWSIPSQNLNDSGSLISTSLMKPSDSNGTHSTVYYGATDSAKCVARDSFQVWTKLNSPIHLLQDSLMCGDSFSILLPNPTSHPNGKWYGNGINNLQFSTQKLNTGHHMLYYFSEDSQSCVSDSVRFSYFHKPKVEAGLDSQICQNQNDIALQGIPKNGIWTGSHIKQKSTQYYFELTNTKANKSYPLYYQYIDSNNCGNTDTIVLTTRSETEITAADIEHCFQGPMDTVKLRAIPLGGIWKGKGLFGKNAELAIDHNSIGTNSYTYSFTNNYGCTSNAIIKLMVYNKPVTNAGFDDTMCIDSSVSYTFSPSPTGGNWTGPGLKDSSTTEISITKSLIGKNKYTYRFEDMHGCKNSDTLLLNVGLKSRAQFIASDTLGMAPITIGFFNQSSNATYNYWNFGNGLTSQKKHPETTYFKEGEYVVELIVLDSLGFCQSTTQQKITIRRNTGIDYIGSDQISIYPNPAHSVLNLEPELKGNFTFTLFNSLGQVVLNQPFSQLTNLNISHLPAGIYNYKVSNAADILSKGKLIFE